jgi:hypothetical protein
VNARGGRLPSGATSGLCGNRHWLAGQAELVQSSVITSETETDPCTLGKVLRSYSVHITFVWSTIIF